jgi:hypothetical protein
MYYRIISCLFLYHRNIMTAKLIFHKNKSIINCFHYRHIQGMWYHWIYISMTVNFIFKIECATTHPIW